MATKKKKKSARANTVRRAKLGTKSAKPPAPTDRSAAKVGPKSLILRTPLGAYDFSAWQGGDVEWTKQLQQAAMEWTYVVRNRQRWRALDQSALSVQKRARTTLETLGLQSGALASISSCGIVEVAVLFEREEAGWEARIFPWEFVISGATRDQRQGKPLTVSRALEKPKRVANSRRHRAVVRKVLYVQSSPGKLRDLYVFDTEREMIEANFGSHGLQVIPLITPTLEELRKKVASERPDIIHLAGFDSHEGMQLLEVPTEGEILDGYLLEGAIGGSATPADALTLGNALTADGKHQPLLVVFNLQNSAARTAPMTVAAGAQNAIGIQDTIDDALVELFFAAFYRAWRRNGWNTHLAFQASWQSMRAHAAALSGTGLVLWSDRQLVTNRTARVHPTAEKAPVWLPAKRLKSADEILKVDVKPLKELNYAQLHNKQPLFDNFTLTNASASMRGDVQATLADVEIEVTLSAGQEETRYRRQVKVDGPSLELRNDVHVPLISMLMRTVNEAMNTSLQVEVKWGRTLFRDSFFVRLLPVDQWRDNDRDGQWLPSFVLPRDRAVPGLIEKAQHYVRVVRDDPTAGFDGYQSYDPQAAEPAAEVDLQVQAIWSMLVHELRLGYVNPPPTFSNELDSQRLRTPSLVVQHRCGTCIDLALLIAACLEHVDMYPVIFLLKDHAFPGYWRSEGARREFMEMDFVPMDQATENRGTTEVAGSQSVPWWFRESAYKEIVRQVQCGALVPLESVWLTEHSGFGDAIDGGRDNLKSARRFHSMLDIVRAREAQVTPLPIGDLL